MRSTSAKHKNMANMPTPIIIVLITTAIIMPSRRYQFAVIRLATSLVIIGLCIFAAPRGWSTAHFAMGRSKGAGAEAVGDELRSWVGTSGIAAAALRASLTHM